MQSQTVSWVQGRLREKFTLQSDELDFLSNLWGFSGDLNSLLTPEITKGWDKEESTPLVEFKKFDESLMRHSVKMRLNELLAQRSGHKDG